MWRKLPAVGYDFQGLMMLTALKCEVFSLPMSLGTPNPLKKKQNPKKKNEFCKVILAY